MSGERRRTATDRDDISSYVVRVYRRETGRSAKSSGNLIGLVEDVRHGQRHAFHSIAELWVLLGFAADPGAPTAHMARSRPRRKPP